ncbi:hypothetical protein SLE2022_221690 [Rubroshorea leprosula]
MGDRILGPVVDATVSKVIAVASDQLSLALGWNKDLKRFCLIMKMLRSVLQEADERNVSGHPHFKSWLQELRTIADEAEDILEEVAYENMRHQLAYQKPKWKRVRYLFTLSNPLAFRMKMANKIKNLNIYLADINDWATRLGLHYKLAKTVREPRASLETHSFLPSQVAGRKEDVTKIVSLLIDSSSQHELPVITIVGMAGLGKTTLAKEVLENDKIGQCFGENKMWVCVSENFDVKRILMEMLESISKSAGGDVSSKDNVLKHIQEKLGDKNFLLILDDVWNEEGQKWEELRNCLLGINKGRNKGSRVLMTTRLKSVASLMAVTDEHIHHPRQLNDDECLIIINQRAFGDKPAPKGLQGIGKQIAKRCKGIPLVASIIGAILQNKRDKREWQAITENRVWDSLEKEGGVLDIIKFSYDRLPTLALKQCFAFCSIFPKDFVMERETLIQLWMAQGFLESSEESCLAAEEIGDKYFKDLLSYSLFQEEERDFLGRVEYCKMHDLIHDFAQLVSNFETLIVEERPAGSNVSHHVRHLNLIYLEEMMAKNLGNVASKLQSLFCKHGFPSGAQVDLKRLRVLSFCGASDGTQLPTCFGNSKSLRYLDISETQLKELPKFITKLYNLQTFRFTNCNSLKMPPGGIGDLINLRHVYFDDEERMPANLGRLTNLQTLPLFFVNTTKGRKIEELGSLTGLKGRLEICQLKLVKDKSKAEGAKLHEKAIEDLVLDWWVGEGNHDNDEDILEGLQPHSNLRRLSIRGYGGRNLASWMLLLKNMGELRIDSCNTLVKIPSINGFPSLQQLYVKDCDELTSLGDGDGDGEGAITSRSLKTLHIKGCPKLERFLVSGLSSLVKLYIGGCDGLECLPSGLSSCTALEELQIWNCSNLISIPEELKQLLSLVKLDIRQCQNLKFIPSLEGLVSLKTVTICDCDGLECLPSGLSSCTALEELQIWDCSNLISIPEELKQLLSLVKLDIRQCQNLKFIPSLEGLVSLKTVTICNCGGLECLPSGLSSCTALEELQIWSCPNLVSIPEELKQLRSLVKLEIQQCQNLKFIPSLEGLVSLKTITIGGCDGLECLPSGLSSCTALEELQIWDCSNLISIPEELKQLLSLVKLDLRQCQNLKFIPSLEGLVSLKIVTICNCGGLECLPSGLSSCTALEELQIWSCPNLVSIPEELKQLRSLVMLDIRKLMSFPGEILGSLASLKTLRLGSFSEELQEFPNLSSTPASLEILRLEGWGASLTLPPQIQRLTALKDLTITSFNGVEEALLGKLSCLKTLEIRDCTRLRCLLGGLSSLEELDITECPNLVSFQGELKELRSLEISGCLKLVGSLGKSLGCCSRLERLNIGPFSEELEEFPSLRSIHASFEDLTLRGWEKLTHLPQIQHLTALKRLTIFGFSGMESLPDWFNNLSSLQRLEIFACPDELKERCTKGSGPDWHKISHIPRIEIDWEIIQSKH